MAHYETSERPVAPVGRRLAVVIGLPLVDGVFVTLVLAGVLESLVGIAMTGVVIFAGSAAAAIVLAEDSLASRRLVQHMLLVGAIIVPLAGIQAMSAPSLATVLDTAVLKGFAAIVLILIAIELVNGSRSRVLPHPGVVVAVGLLFSVVPSAQPALHLDPVLFWRGAAAAALGILAVCVMILLGDVAQRRLHAGRMRIAGAISLGVLAIAILSEVEVWMAALVLLGGVSISLTIPEGRLRTSFSGKDVSSTMTR